MVSSYEHEKMKYPDIPIYVQDGRSKYYLHLQ